MWKKANIWFWIFATYVLAAGAWWSYLLYIKNLDAWEAKKALYHYEMQSKGIYDEAFYLSAPEYVQMNDKYQRQGWMVIGEAIVLLVLLILGMGQIHRARKREIALARQQQNFLLSITHELKSPLASIQLSLQTFLRHQLPYDKVEKLSTQSLKEAQRLHQHIETMLLAARIENGYQYQFELLDLLQLIHSCIERLRTHFKGEIQLHTTLEEALIHADKYTLESAIFNLIENAIKYAKETPYIHVVIQKDKLEKFFVLKIMDMGKGIPDAEKMRVFDKFYRVGSEQTRTSKGTGLGLYIVQQFVKAHRGTIRIEDNQPAGTIFIVELPMN